MEEHWEHWFPVGPLSEHYEITHLTQTTQFFEVIVTSYSTIRKIQLIFPMPIIACQVVPESYSYMIGSHILTVAEKKAENPGFPLLFRSTNSLYLESLRASNPEIAQKQLTHYAIIEPNDMMDIVSCNEPVVTLIQNIRF